MKIIFRPKKFKKCVAGGDVPSVNNEDISNVCGWSIIQSSVSSCLYITPWGSSNISGCQILSHTRLRITDDTLPR